LFLKELDYALLSCSNASHHEGLHVFAQLFLKELDYALLSCSNSSHHEGGQKIKEISV
jgi:hypothetical protein